MEAGKCWMEVKNSTFGNGLFAKQNIYKGATLLSIKGKMISFQDTLSMDDESYALQIDFDRYIVLQPPMVYCNHSCLPNCGINHHLELIAIKDINAGEELFWEYSTSMLERHWTMQCYCGTKHCRKQINDFDQLPAELQKQYMEMKIVFPFIYQFLVNNIKKSA